MPAGFKYDLKPIEKTMPELCRFETVYRLSGGFNLDTTNLTGIDKIPPMTPLVIDFKTRTAKAVVNVEVYEKYTTGTSMKIKKGVSKDSPLYRQRVTFIGIIIIAVILVLTMGLNWSMTVLLSFVAYIILNLLSRPLFGK